MYFLARLNALLLSIITRAKGCDLQPVFRLRFGLFYGLEKSRKNLMKYSPTLLNYFLSF